MRNFALNFFISLFFCSLVTLFALSRFDYQLTGIDDANIYFVYAKNVASGHGFVYNVGEERIEGFTSLLWTLICAFTFKFSRHPELILLIINVVLVSLGIAVALSYLQNDFLGVEKSQQTKIFCSSIFLVLLLTSPRYIVWNTITLMENGLWTTLLLFTTLFVIKDHSSTRTINFGLIPLSILLILTRPESMLWIAIFMGIILIRKALSKNIITAVRALMPSFVATGVALGLLTLFRLQYFGYPLPNTYYAKVSPSLSYNLEGGAVYLLKYLTSDPIDFLSVSLVFLFGLQTLYRIYSKQSLNDGAAFLSIIAGVGFLMPLITGGDHFGSFRFYQSIYPITLLSLFYIFDRILFKRVIDKATFFPRTLKLALVLVSGVGVFLSQAQIGNHLRSEIGTEFQVAQYERENGELIQKLFLSLPHPPSIGVIAAGGIKYNYEGEIVDLMGLNNTIMAHNGGRRAGYKNHAAFEVNTFFKLEPDIVWPREVNESTWQYTYAEVMEGWENKEGFKGLFSDLDFLNLYTFAKVKHGQITESPYALVAWFKKDFLIQLRESGAFQVVEYAISQ